MLARYAGHSADQGARLTVDPVPGVIGAGVLRHLLGKQRQQHFVAVLVAGGGNLTLGYQTSIERDVFLVYETFHFVPQSVPAKRYRRTRAVYRGTFEMLAALNGRIACLILNSGEIVACSILLS